MINFLIVEKKRIEKHVGEEYDDYIEVDMFVEPSNMPSIANIIRNKIREVVINYENEKNISKRIVNVEIDAPPVYNVIAVGLLDSMIKEEGIELVLSEHLDIKDRTNEIEEK